MSWRTELNNMKVRQRQREQDKKDFLAEQTRLKKLEAFRKECKIRREPIGGGVWWDCPDPCPVYTTNPRCKEAKGCIHLRLKKEEERHTYGVLAN